MKFRGLLAAVVVLAALGGAAWWSEKKEKADAAKPPADAPPKILSIPDDQFKQIQLVKKGGETTTAEPGRRQMADRAAQAAGRRSGLRRLAGVFALLVDVRPGD